MITEKIDSITRIGEDFRHSVLPAPKSVKIELTGACNYRCGFCALRMRPEASGEIDWKLLVRVMGEMRGAGVRELGLFFLGESFTSPDLLVRTCKKAKELGFPYVFLTTNGSLGTGDLFAELFSAGLDSLKFSINAYSEDQFVKVMGVKRSLWKKALENVRLAREVRDALNSKCGLYASSIKYDGEQQEKMEEVLKEYVLPFVDEHYWLPLYSMGAFATQREEELGYKPIAGNQGRLGALREPLPCWSAFTEGHITSKGKLSACCFDASGSWEMADLNEVSFMDGWNSLKFQDLRSAHLKKSVEGTICENCVAYK